MHYYKDGESKINFVFLLIVCFIVTVPIAFGVINLIRKIQINRVNREKRICNKKEQLRVGGEDSAEYCFRLRLYLSLFLL